VSWQSVKLGTVAVIRGGIGFPRKHQDDKTGTVPFAKVGDISQALKTHPTEISTAKNYVSAETVSELRARVFPKGTIVMAKIGEAIRLNRRAITTREMLIDNNAVGIVPNQTEIDPLFLLYYLRTVDSYNIASKTVVPSVKKSTLEEIDVPLPALAEQRRIVARIKECMARVDEIEALRGEALQEYVALQTALLGAIIEPDGWSSMKVGDLVTTTRNGRSISTSNEGATGFVLGLSAVRGVNLDTTARKPIVLPSDILAKYPVSRGDVFVSRSNTQELVGLASVATQDVNNCIYPDLLIKLSPNTEIIQPRFLAYALRVPSTRAQIRERASGTSQSMVKISGARLKEVAIPVPPLEMQSLLIDKLDQVHDRATDLLVDLNSPEITQLRESILRKAFAGEL
jgi:type I restriction enzyme, S subunit